MTTSATPASNATFRQDAWVIGLVGLAHAISHFYHLILAPLFPWLKEAFNVSYAELGLLMTMFFVVSGAGQFAAGFIVDRLGARNVLFFGMACLGLSALVLAGAQNYAMLMAGSMLAGLGNSIFHPSDLTLLNRRVSPSRLGHAFSMHGLSGSLGWAAAPVFLVAAAGIGGWRSAMLAASVLPFGFILVMIWKRKQLAYDLPSSNAQGDTSSDTSSTPEAGESITAFLRLPAIWMCFSFFVISALALGAIQSFSATGLRALYDMPLAWATAAYSVFMLASAAGTLWGGTIASRNARPERTIAIAFVGAGMMAWLLATGLPSAAMAIVLMAAIGFGSGVAGPSRDMMIRAASPRNATGRVYGVVYSGLDIGLAGAPLLFGALMDAGKPGLVFAGVGLFQVCAVLTALSVGGRTAKLQAAAPAAPQ